MKITYIACFTICSRLVTPQSCPTCEEEPRAPGRGEGCKVPGYLALSAQVGKAASVSKGSPPRKSRHPGVGIGEKVHWRGEGRRFQKWWGDPMAGTTSPPPLPFLSQLTVWYYSHHSSLYVFATFMWHTYGEYIMLCDLQFSLKHSLRHLCKSVNKVHLNMEHYRMG